MSTSLETGHAKNISNFASLISFCKGYGIKYKPSRDALKIVNLDAQYDAAAASLDDVKTQKSNFDNAANARKAVFNPLKKLATKIINALDATEATPATVKDAIAINRKIQGSRAGEKPAAPPVTAGDDTKTETPKSISVSQQSFNQLVESLASLITLLAAEPAYAPNEEELTVVALSKLLNSMRTSNQDVIDANTNIENSRLNRNKLLYQKPAGLVPISIDVKKYVKSVFGNDSPEFKQVSSLAFKTPNDRLAF